MFWAMWAVFALAILAIGVGLLYLAFGAKHMENKGGEDKYQGLPDSEIGATGELDNKDLDHRQAG